jgi:hypothetical protein
MADQGATVLRFPVIYRIAYSNGEECGMVAGAEFRQFWQAEHGLYDLQAKHPELTFWVTWKPND